MLTLDGALVTRLVWKPSPRMGLHKGVGIEHLLKLGGLPAGLRAGPGVTLLVQFCMEPHTPSITAHTPCARWWCGA